MPPDIPVIPAAPAHLGALPAIELAAAARFRGWSVPPSMFTEATPLSMYLDAELSSRLEAEAARGLGTMPRVALCKPLIHLTGS